MGIPGVFHPDQIGADKAAGIRFIMKRDGKGFVVGKPIVFFARVLILRTNASNLLLLQETAWELWLPLRTPLSGSISKVQELVEERCVAGVSSFCSVSGASLTRTSS